MKLSPIYAASLLVLGLSVSVARAQEQPKAEEKARSEEQITPLKVTVVFNEFDGEKKVSSLPYVIFLKASRDSMGSVRMGVRVPVWTGAKDSAIQYQDVGSNIDCWAHTAQGDRYVVDLRLERSSLYTGKDDHPVAQKPDEELRQPIMRQFRSNSTVTLRDGQTTQSIMATDPLNGHTIRVDVTLNVLK